MSGKLKTNYIIVILHKSDEQTTKGMRPRFHFIIIIIIIVWVQ